MEVGGFRLEKEEIARQIHYVLREIYPERQFDANRIYDMVVEEASPNRKLVFPADKFAEVSGMDGTEFTASLFRELGVEFEKNLHDKFFFTMRREQGKLIFQTMEQQ
ncbi:MAG: hypothetical protein HRF51_00900 [bacterium]|jgi:hypothetical protein